MFITQVMLAIPYWPLVMCTSSDESVSIVYAESEEALLSQDSNKVDLTVDDTRSRDLCFVGLLSRISSPCP